MFTGIINRVSIVEDIKKSTAGLILNLKKPKNWKVKRGNSVSVNGVCSTVKDSGSNLVFEYMPETLDRTNLKDLTKGQKVNLEQSLTVLDRLEGQIMLGHVDCAGIIRSITKQGNSKNLKIVFPKSFRQLVAAKGSVVLEGISLTTVAVGETYFSVKIIPYTWENTNLCDKKIGDRLNLEFDILAKYANNFLTNVKERQ